MKRHFLFVWVPLLIVALVLGGCQSNSGSDESTTKTQETSVNSEASKALPSTIGIGTEGTGGTGYTVGTGVAKVISDYTPIRVVTQPSAGPTAFVPLLETGELMLGMQTGNDVGWAYTGGTGYSQAYKNIRVLVRGHEVPTIPLVVRLDSGIKKIEDLRGKRVSGEFGSNKSILAVVTAGLESGGLTWNDVKIVPVPDPRSSLIALQEGRADAAFGASPTTPFYNEVNTAIPLQVLNFGNLPPEQAVNPPQELIKTLKKYQPAASIHYMKKVGYLKADATIIRYPFWLTSSEKLSEDAAYEITKALFENDGKLQAMGGLLQGWKQATMFDPNPNAPYHDGAVRLWKEKGLWTPEAEANQKRLLDQ